MNELAKSENQVNLRQKFLLWLRDKFFFWLPNSRKHLIQIIQKATHRGVLNEDALVMIEGVLHVSDMRVRDIMIPSAQMKVIKKDATFDEMQKIVVDTAHSRFPVIGDDGDRVEGILLAKDLLRYFSSEEQKNFRTSELLRQPYAVPESKRLQVLLKEFRRSRNHIAIVVNEYGGVSGLVTIEDVLEQIVGDITDEHDVAEDQYIYDRGQGYLVKALTPLDDFNHYFGSALNNNGSDTIGGLIISAFGHLPKRGETIHIGKFSFEVSRADTRRIHELFVKK